MRISIALASAAAVTLGTVALAPAASAYDRDAYSFAAGHMIERSDIPSGLGNFSSKMDFNGYQPSYDFFLCTVPGADQSIPSTDVKIPSGKFQWSAGYNSTSKSTSSISVTVNQFASEQDAIKAFGTTKKLVKSCDGKGSSSWTDPDSGVTTTISSLVTNGVVPSVTVVGVESLFVSQDNLSQSSTGESRYVDDQYIVLSLADDAIIVTSYYANAGSNISSKQRKSVNQVAFNAITRWVD